MGQGTPSGGTTSGPHGSLNSPVIYVPLILTVYCHTVDSKGTVHQYLTDGTPQYD